GPVLQERDLGAASVRLVVAGGLRHGTADAELGAQDALGPDHRLLVAAGAGVGQAPQGADHDDVVVGEDLGAGVHVAEDHHGARGLDASAAAHGARDDNGLAPRLQLVHRRTHVGERAAGVAHAAGHGLDHLDRRPVGDLERDPLLEQVGVGVERLLDLGDVVAGLEAQQYAAARTPGLHREACTSTPLSCQYPARKSRATGTETRELEPPYSMNTT